MTKLTNWRKMLLISGVGVLLLAAALTLVIMLRDMPRSDALAASDDVQYGDVLYSIYTSDVSHQASISPALSQPQPQIDLPASFGNMGRVTYGDTVEKTFVVRNEGESALTIHNIYSTCTFVTAELTASVISPGKAALLTITLHADEYPDEGGDLIRRGVVLHSDDPLQSETTVWIQARITR